MEDQLVWAPDTQNGYVLGRVIDIKSNPNNLATIRIESNQLNIFPGYQRNSSTNNNRETNETIECSIENVYPTEIDLQKDYDDNCSLMFLNEGNLLHNIRLRYFKNKIYTYVANILIALNPYYDLREQLYSSKILQSYQGKSLGKMPPHVFAIADKAYNDMKRMLYSQSIIVSGESGAGKTESTKYILRYICESFGDELQTTGQKTNAIQIEQLILEANPLLEAFGNAKTARNNNSSRFGKFIEIYMNRKFSVAGGHISHYLLEKSRICGINSPLERNYHIFYQLCVGLPKNLWEKLCLKPPDKFAYLNKGCTQYFLTAMEDKNLSTDRKSQQHLQEGYLSDSIVNDLAEFHAMDRALHHFGLNDSEKMIIYEIVAAILHLGNIQFEESPNDSHGGCRIIENDLNSQQALKDSAKLLGVDVDQLQQCLQTRIMQTQKGGYKGSTYMVPLKVYEAQNARDALAKAIYSRLFDYIVSKIINRKLPTNENQQQQQYSIGVLDIAGFEYFQTNSFEQFCINYCNEKLQNFFNERILNDEQKLYEQEALGLKHIDYVDNHDCIELFESKSYGIFDLLDEESRLPKPSSLHFTEMVHKINGSKFRLDLPRKFKLKLYRDLRDDEGFIIRHFAGAVCYQTGQFIEKNNDSLHTNLAFLMLESNNEMLKQFFQTDSQHSNQSNQHSNSSTNFSSTSLADKSVRLSAESVGSKFRKQLADLIGRLQSTGTHFIRCIKPNLKMISKNFDGGCILSQLKCSGMISVLQLMQYGFPSRCTYLQIYELYSTRLPKRLSSIEPRFFCHALIKSVGLNIQKDVCFGVTKIFFRPGRFAEFDLLLRNDDPKQLDQLVRKVQHWLISSRWRRAQWCSLSVIKLKNKIIYRRQCIIIIQKYIRMYLARKKYRPHYECLKQLKLIENYLNNVQPLIKKIQNDQERQTYSQKLLSINENLKSIPIDSIIPDTDPKIMDKNKCLKQIDLIRKEIDKLIINLEQALNEQELRLKYLQQELEQQRLRQIEEEQLKQKQEQKRRELNEQRELIAKQFVQTETVNQQTENGYLVDPSSLSTDQPSSLMMIMNEEERQKQIDYLKRLEQERRDYELALRLSQDGNIVQQQQQSQDEFHYNPYVNSVRQQESMVNHPNNNNRKYKLENWNYAKLRDTINTSNDIELLELCREEFHRRLKVYHQWKDRIHNSRSLSTTAPTTAPAASNDNQLNNNNNNNNLLIMQQQQQQQIDNNNRAPVSIMNSTTSSSSSTMMMNNNQVKSTKQQQQRYFRLPFDRHCGQSKGVWYAHFDGKWIARQMEIHPKKKPILLIAGIDDLKMCELSLDETGLTGKRGAEILPEEFEAVWCRNGGSQSYRLKK
ncbi:myosin heavy chain 95F jaguar [Dermatophagoides pteronyssinus]|uniref:myosin heavy chain 95F jaguar n=1 Tax=Dermatophagoides pteronyssinus TaxID=6956 RepID=UPI003F673329